MNCQPKPGFISFIRTSGKHTSAGSMVSILGQPCSEDMANPASFASEITYPRSLVSEYSHFPFTCDEIRHGKRRLRNRSPSDRVRYWQFRVIISELQTFNYRYIHISPHELATSRRLQLMVLRLNDRKPNFIHANHV